ncbi:MAG: TetR family transcriptional regulator [Mucilaginibacter sp.]|jgi:TetR/AcrR family transcriptional repressor of nem operon|nr:TetR family transcriptional regulator [Mucilaginibacter sp.]
MSKELSKAERTRQYIIETTSVVFNKKGYAGTSLSDLTEATGLTKGSIYGNFENKEEVALAVFDYNCCRTTDMISKRMAGAHTFYDKLMVYTRVYSSQSLSERGGCAILNTAVEADDTNDLLKEKAAKAVLKWKKNITELIEGGIAAGEFKADINVEQTAISMVALIEGGIMIGKVTNSQANLSQVLKTVESVINQMKR